jgi:TRAP-type mannitol/chloroaromatic compound transport system permease large subunit
VAFGLAATGLLFGFIGMEIGPVPDQPVPGAAASPVRHHAERHLLAIPFFTFMGLILERSGMAEDLLQTVGQVFGPLRGGLAVAVVLVGALLAATTGVVAASVISMGLISLPIMLRYGYNRSIATGVITASGTLAQAIPPSLVLIVLADQLGRSVGDMYPARCCRPAMLVGLYLLFVALLAFVARPKWVPALPAEARGLGGSRRRQRAPLAAALLAVCGAAGGWAWCRARRGCCPSAARCLRPPMSGDPVADRGGTVALVLALANRVLRWACCRPSPSASPSC